MLIVKRGVLVRSRLGRKEQKESQTLSERVLPKQKNDVQIYRRIPRWFRKGIEVDQRPFDTYHVGKTKNVAKFRQIDGGEATGAEKQNQSAFSGRRSSETRPQ